MSLLVIILGFPLITGYNKRINLDNITSNEWGNPSIITSNDMINPGNNVL